MPVRAYLEHLPTRAAQRVVRSMIAELDVSSRFAESQLAISALSLQHAKTKMDAALLISCDLERMSLSVRSDLTVEGQHHQRLV